MRFVFAVFLGGPLAAIRPVWDPCCYPPLVGLLVKNIFCSELLQSNEPRNGGHATLVNILEAGSKAVQQAPYAAWMPWHGMDPQIYGPAGPAQRILARHGTAKYVFWDGNTSFFVCFTIIFYGFFISARSLHLPTILKC